MNGHVLERYTRTAMVLHWLVALLITANLALVWTLDSYPDDFIRPAVNLHKSIGLTVLGLGVLRLLWRFSHRPPALPRSYPRLERLGAHAAHALLYVLILGLPLSGYIHDSAFKDADKFPLTLFGLVTIPRLGFIQALDPATKEQVHDVWFSVHGALAYALYALFALHVLGALKHQFIDKEAEFARMVPGSRTGASRTTARESSPM